MSSQSASRIFTGLTHGWSRQPSALPFEVTLRVPHGFLLGFYKRNSPLALSRQTMWATCQSDGTWTGRLFLLHWTKSPVDKPLQKGNAMSILLRRSGPWKSNTNRFEVPHIITEDTTCLSSWFSFFFLWIITGWPWESSCLYITNITMTTWFNARLIGLTCWWAMRQWFSVACLCLWAFSLPVPSTKGRE